MLNSIKKKRENIISFDVMLNERYVCTMNMRHCPLFAITDEEIVNYVLEKRPSLKNKPFNIEFN